MKRPSLNSSLILLLLLIAAGVYWHWISFDIFSKGDWSFVFSRSGLSLLKVSSWNSLSSLGTFDLTLWRFPLNFLYGVFSYFGLDKNVYEKFLVFWPTVIVGFGAAYLLIKKVVGSSPGAFVGALVFNLNTYYLVSSSHILLYSAASFGLLGLYFYIRALDEDRPKFYVLSCLSLLVTTVYDFRILYLLSFVFAGYFFFHLYLLRSVHQRRTRWELVYTNLLFGGVMFLLNFFWIVTFVKTGSLIENEVVSRGLFGNSYWTLQSSFSLFHPFWSGAYVEWFKVNSMPAYFWIIPLMAFAGLVLNRKNVTVLFFGLLALGGVFLAKQVDAPFPSVYPWLHSNFPGFNAFREATKFYFYIALGYSVLIASLLSWLIVNMRGSFLKRILRNVMGCLIVGLFCLNVVPLVTGKIGALSVPRHVPADYVILNNFISSQKEYFRTLWLPRDIAWFSYDLVHPKLSTDGVIADSWNEPLKDSLSMGGLFAKKIKSAVSTAFFAQLLNQSSIKYVIVPSRDIENDNDFYPDYGGDPQYYSAILDSLPYLKRIEIGTKEVAIYENLKVLPYVYSLSSIFAIDTTENIASKWNLVRKMDNQDLNFTIPKNAENPSFPYRFLKMVFENIHVSSFHNTSLVAQTGLENVGDGSMCTASGSTVSCRPYSSPTFTYPETAVPLNVIANGSFEKGAWQEIVGDCNKYDNNPVVAMDISSDGFNDGAALELSATQHIACTKQTFPIQGSKKYLFSFNYDSPNASQVGYYLEYNVANPDTNSKASYQELIPNKIKEWTSYSRIIDVPAGSTQATLYIYSYSKETGENVITKYDDFSMIPLPNDILDYWAVSSPGETFKDPKNILFETGGTTKKFVHIKGATTPFYLAMSESYHPQWRLAFNDRRVNGWLSSWTPIENPHVVPDEHHFELNGFLNGWYVDTEAYCVRQNLCTKNADGSYDMEMVIEFAPQRWFYIGLLVSGATLLACLGYLGYVLVRRRKGRKLLVASSQLPEVQAKSLGASLLRDVKERSTKRNPKKNGD